MEAQSAPPPRLQKVEDFEGAIARNLRPQRGKTNLTKFQATILQQIRSNQDIIIAYVNKILGTVGVDTKQYIRWVLGEHLTNATAYVQVSEANTHKAAFNLYTEICK